MRLRLFVVPSAPNSQLAVANLAALCAEHFGKVHELEIVDVLEHPARAINDRIIVTPTLLRVAPLPERRVIGNLSDHARTLLVLKGG